MTRILTGVFCLPLPLSRYVTTAANPTESSWGNYCPPDDSVDGTEVGSCLGDTYSTNWMENTDQVGPSETLQAQYLIVQNLTNQSHVMQYGALDFTSYPTGDFIGEGAAEEYVDVEVDLSRAAPKRSSQVSSRDIPLHLSYYRYLRAETFSPESAKHLAALRAQLDSREAAQNRFLKLAELLSVDSKGRRRGTAEHLFNAPATPIRSGVCIQVSLALTSLCSLARPLWHGNSRSSVFHVLLSRSSRL
jgi:hypothetical protein